MKKTDSKKWIAYCVLPLLLLILFSANFIQKKIFLKTSAASEKLWEAKISALIIREKNEEARQIAFSKLLCTDNSDHANLSFLYNSIGKSYQNSFHFDSAVYYAKKAYDASKKTNNKKLLTESATELLRMYGRSAIYNDVVDSLFNELNNINKSDLPISVHASALDVITQYYMKNLKEDMAIVTATEAVNLCNKYLRHHTPSYEDSINVAECYHQMGYANLSYNYRAHKTDSVVNEQKKKEGLYYFNLARAWMGSYSRLLAWHYYRSCFIEFSKDEKLNLHRTMLSCDSLAMLAKKTRSNFNDMLLIANVSLANIVYNYALNKQPDKTQDCWQYHYEAAKYDNDLVDPACHSCLEWQKGSLYLRFHQYSKALDILKPMKNELNLMTIKHRKWYNSEIIQCYEGLGNKDSTIVYYKKELAIADSLNISNLRKITSEADDKYQAEVNQQKVDKQTIIIQYANKQRTFLFIGISILTCLLVLLIIIYRNKNIAANKLDEKNTILKSLNQHLKEANETKAKLFAIIGHDLRSPIEELHLLLKLQRSKDFVLSAEKKYRYEEDIQFATTNLLESMEGLLIWSRTQLQSFAPVKSLVDINKIVNQCIHLMLPLINSKKLKIENQIAHGNIIETDANFLLAILRNIIQNAIKASPNEGAITMKYEDAGINNKKCIKVINNGHSFSQHDYLELITQVKTSEELWHGFGLHLIDEFSQKINATIFFEMLREKTTCCTITLNARQNSFLTNSN